MHSPVGDLTLFEEDGALIVVEWGWAPDGDPTPLLSLSKQQLEEYFAGTRRMFDLPMRPGGTQFQVAVCNAMLRIPYGELRTYGEIADDTSSAPRAVGGACGRNPIPILIPCHRVVGANGKLTGFSGGKGVSTKRTLLTLEQRHAGLEVRLN